MLLTEPSSFNPQFFLKRGVRNEDKTGSRDNPLSPLALGDDALDLVESAVGAGSTVLDNVAPDLPSTAALAGL